MAERRHEERGLSSLCKSPAPFSCKTLSIRHIYLSHWHQSEVNFTTNQSTFNLGICFPRIHREEHNTWFPNVFFFLEKSWILEIYIGLLFHFSALLGHKLNMYVLMIHGLFFIFNLFTLRYISALWIFGRQFTLDDHPSFEAENRGVVRSKSDPRQDLAISADSSIISPSLKAKDLGIIRDEDLAHAPVYKPWLFCPVKT